MAHSVSDSSSCYLLDKHLRGIKYGDRVTQSKKTNYMTVESGNNKSKIIAISQWQIPNNVRVIKIRSLLRDEMIYAIYAWDHERNKMDIKKKTRKNRLLSFWRPIVLWELDRRVSFTKVPRHVTCVNLSTKWKQHRVGKNNDFISLLSYKKWVSS